ncbi:MAG: DUF1572 family protein [Aurantibacter sp.]
MTYQEDYLKSALYEFHRYKTLGEKTFAQLSDKDLLWKYGGEDNSIAQIVKHLSGNMLSRWTNFLTEDGEKEWRKRDTEFVDPPSSRKELLETWEKGWNCLFDALNSIKDSNFDSKIKIRNQPLSVIEATNRQLAHYANHVGQIILLGKMIKGKDWVSLSVPKGASKAFNKEKFGH